jgi:hypothetical protein
MDMLGKNVWETRTEVILNYYYQKFGLKTRISGSKDRLHDQNIRAVEFNPSTL